MPDRNDLTQKQLKVLKIIETEITRTGYAPTYRAIAKQIGVNAVGTVQDYIAKLLELGFLEKEKGPYGKLRLAFQTRITWVPILGNVPAGKPIEAVHDHQGSLALAGHWRGDLFALKIKGESMKDHGILDGDFVIVQSQPDADHGQVIVALVDQEATVKILEKKNGKLRLLPSNPAFSPIELKPDRENKIVGRVIGVQRTYLNA